MKKILLCCIVVVLTMIICVVPSFATQGVFSIDFETLTFYYDLQSDVYVGDFTCSIVYTPEVPFYDGMNSLYIDSVEIVYDGNNISATCYDGIDAITFTDSPDFTLFAGNVDYVVYDSTGDEITTDIAMDLFGRVFVDASLSVVDYSPLESIFIAFGFVFSWLPASVVTLIGIFWTGSALTPIGVLSVAGLSIGVILLIFSIISRYLKFRG